MLKREKSQPIFERAMSVIAKGVNSNFRYWGPKSTPVISHAKGAYITDADDNTFIDYRLGWGPIILGHADDRINEAVSEAVKNGTTFVHYAVIFQCPRKHHKTTLMLCSTLGSHMVAKANSEGA